MKAEHDRPSRHGQILGEALALIAELGRRDAVASGIELPECCLTCAFRPGCMTNQMAATGKVALDIVLGIDQDRFACHHGMKNGEPQKLCAGYAAAILAPWSMTREVVIRLKAQIDAMSGSDEVRADFDRWLAEVDPTGVMDAYQLARAYERRPKAEDADDAGADFIQRRCERFSNGPGT